MSSNKNFPLYVIGTVIIVMSIVVVVLSLNSGPELIKPPPTTVQDLGPAPDFTIDILDGEEKSLRDYRGKPVVLNFWASWCPPCRQEAPDLVELHKKYGDRVDFVGIIYQDEEGAARRFIEEFGIEYENGMDAGGKASAAYKITGIPTTCVIDAQGDLRAKWLGAITSEVLTSYIEGVL